MVPRETVLSSRRVLMFPETKSPCTHVSFVIFAELINYNFFQSTWKKKKHAFIASITNTKSFEIAKIDDNIFLKQALRAAVFSAGNNCASGIPVGIYLNLIRRRWPRIYQSPCSFCWENSKCIIMGGHGWHTCRNFAFQPRSPVWSRLCRNLNIGATFFSA